MQCKKTILENNFFRLISFGFVFSCFHSLENLSIQFIVCHWSQLGVLKFWRWERKRERVESDTTSVCQAVCNLCSLSLCPCPPWSKFFSSIPLSSIGICFHFSQTDREICIWCIALCIISRYHWGRRERRDREERVCVGWRLKMGWKFTVFRSIYHKHEM